MHTTFIDLPPYMQRRHDLRKREHFAEHALNGALFPQRFIVTAVNETRLMLSSEQPIVSERVISALYKLHSGNLPNDFGAPLFS